MSDAETCTTKSLEHAVDAFSGAMKAIFQLQERAMVGWADGIERLGRTQANSQQLLEAARATFKETTLAMTEANLAMLKSWGGAFDGPAAVSAVLDAQAEAFAAAAQVIEGVIEAGTDVAMAAEPPPQAPQPELQSMPPHHTEAPVHASVGQ